MSAHAQIVGWSHIPFGKLVEPDTEALMSRVSLDALEHAGVGSSEVDGIYVGVMNNGFTAQDFQGGLVALADPALAHTPATRLENACATGSAAIYQGLTAIQAGNARHVLCVGMEKMTACDTATVGATLWSTLTLRTLDASRSNISSEGPSTKKTNSSSGADDTTARSSSLVNRPYPRAFAQHAPSTPIRTNQRTFKMLSPGPVRYPTISPRAHITLKITISGNAAMYCRTNCRRLTTLRVSRTTSSAGRAIAAVAQASRRPKGAPATRMPANERE
jgi:hypothetical protein